MRRYRAAERGQAAVEAALTLPLALFMVLGTLQLFLMLQARLMAEHAAFRTVRTGSLSQGSCTRMMHSAITTLLPTFAKTDDARALAQAFGTHRDNRYQPGRDWGRDGPIVWVIRESPQRGRITNGADDFRFDDPDRGDPLRLEVRLIFWYPMKIPFANQVIAYMTLAAWGLGDYQAANPLMPTQTADWSAQSGGAPNQVPARVLGEFRARTLAGQYVFPIQTTAAMRMMTPAMDLPDFFGTQDCGVAP